MRFKYGSHILMIACLYVLYLWISGQLNLYIHPRYVAFAGVGSVFGAALAAKDVVRARPKGRAAVNSPDLSLLLIVFIGLMLPAASLSESTFSQRLVGSGSQSLASSSIDASLLAGSSKGLNVRDWAGLLSRYDDPGFYAQKPASVSGFIYDAGLGGDTVWVARFIVTCCAVDARPVGVPVGIADWENSFSEGDWVSVEGIFRESDPRSGLILVPDSLELIDEPKDPYVQ